VTQVWPIWDSIVAGTIYRNGQTVYTSTVLANELGLASRIEPVPPPKQLMAETAGLFSDEDIPRRARAGRWEFVWVAEIEDPVPIPPLQEDELAAFPTGTLDLIQLAIACSDAAFPSHTKWLLIDDRRGPIEVAFEMSELLGYEPADHSWIPESWIANPVEPGFKHGYETVMAADGLEATLRYFSLRLDGFSVYLPRLWFGEHTDESSIKITLPTPFPNGTH